MACSDTRQPTAGNIFCGTEEHTALKQQNVNTKHRYGNRVLPNERQRPKQSTKQQKETPNKNTTTKKQTKQSTFQTIPVAKRSIHALLEPSTYKLRLSSKDYSIIWYLLALMELVII